MNGCQPDWNGKQIQLLSTGANNMLYLRPGNSVQLQFIDSNYSFSNLNVAQNANISTLSTTQIQFYPDGSLLRAVGNLLYYGDEPIAQPSQISSIGDWSLSPAISSINANGNNILNANYTFTNTLSSAHVQSQTAWFSTITAGSMVIENVYAISTIDSTDYISTQDVLTDFVIAEEYVSTALLKANLVSSLKTETVSSIAKIGDFSTITTNNLDATNKIYAGGSLEVGTVLTPATAVNFNAVDIDMKHYNPLTDLDIASLGGIDIRSFGVSGIDIVNSTTDINIEATAGDLNLTGFDVNIQQNDPLSVLNVTSVGNAVIASGIDLNLTAGGLISITTPGQIEIGSGNVLGAYTSIEKIKFLDSTISTDVDNGIHINDLSTINGIPIADYLNVNLSSFNSVETSTLTTSSIYLSPSTLITSDPFYSALKVQNLNGGYAQVDASALRAVDSGSNGIFYYQSATNRPGFIDNNGVAHTIAYGTDVLSTFSTFAISSVQVNNASVSSLKVSTLQTQALNASYLTTSLSAFDPENNVNHSIVGANFLEANAMFTQTLGTGIGGGSNTSIGVTANFLMSEDRRIFLKHNQQSTILAGTGIITSDVSTITLHTSSINGINPYDWAFKTDVTSSIVGVEQELVSSSTGLINSINLLDSNVNSTITGTTLELNSSITAVDNALISSVSSIEYQIAGASSFNTIYVSSVFGADIDTNYIRVAQTGIGGFSTIVSTFTSTTLIGGTPIYLAFGQNSGSAINVIQRSTDGKSWSPSAYGASWTNSVAYHGDYNPDSGLWVAGGQGPSIKYSIDNGVTWANANNGFANATYRVRWVPQQNKWVACGFGNDKTVASSTDGINWTDFVSPWSVYGWDIIYSPEKNLYVGAGFGGYPLKYSTDAINWSQGTGVTINYGQACFYDSTKQLFYGAGDQNGTLSVNYSSDGSNWQQIASGGFDYAGLGIHSQGNLVLVGGGFNPRLIASTDGSNFSSAGQTGVQSGDVQDITYNATAGNWVSIGRSGSSNDTVKWSTDASNWNSPTSWAGMNIDGILHGLNTTNAGQTVSTITFQSTIIVPVPGSATAGTYITPSSIVVSTLYTSSFLTTELYASLASTNLLVANNVEANNGMFNYISVADLSTNSISTSQISTVGLSASNITTTVGNIQELFVSSLYVQQEIISTSYQEVNNLSTISTNVLSAGQAYVDTLTNNSINTNSISSGLAYLDTALVSNLSTNSASVGQAFIQSISSFDNWTNHLTANIATLGEVSASNISTSYLSANQAYINELSTNLLQAQSISANTLVVYGSNTLISQGSTIFTSATNVSSLAISGDVQMENNTITVGSPDSSVSVYSPLYVAVGSATIQNRSVRISTDGSNWVNSSNGVGLQMNYGGIAYNNSNWVFCGQFAGTQRGLQYSTDAFNWANANQDFTSRYGIDVEYLADGYFYACGLGSSTGVDNLKKSSDGINWTSINVPNMTATLTIGYANGIYIVSGDAPNSNDTIKRSTDGLNWTNTVSGGFQGFDARGLAFGAGVWVATGQGTDGVPQETILWSDDNGLNWHPATSGGFAFGYGYDVKFNGSYFVACGLGDFTGNMILKSLDGKAWTNNLGGFPNFAQAVDWTGDKWIAVGGSSTTSAPNNIKFSLNGSFWTNALGNNFTQGVVPAGRGIRAGSTITTTLNIIPKTYITNSNISTSSAYIDFLTATSNVDAPSISTIEMTAGVIQTNDVFTNALGATQVTAELFQGNSNSINSTFTKSISAGTAIITDLATRNLSTTLLSSGQAYIYTLFNNSLSVNSVSSGAIFADSISTNSLSSANAYVDTLFNNSLSVNSVSSGSIFADSISTNSLSSANAYVETFLNNSLSTNQISAGQAYVDGLSANQVYINDLSNSTITNYLVSSYAVLTDFLFANSSIMNRLVATEINGSNVYNIRTSTNTLSAGVAFVDRLQATNISTSFISVNQAYIDTLTARGISTTNFSTTLGQVSFLTANNISANTISANTAYIDKLSSTSVSANQIYASSFFTTALGGSTTIHDAYITSRYITATDYVSTAQLFASSGVIAQLTTDNINNNSSITTLGLSTTFISANQAFINNVSVNTISTNSIDCRNICSFGTAFFADLIIDGAQKFGGFSTITNATLNATYPIDVTAYSVYNIIYSQNTSITASPNPGTGYVMNVVASNSGTQSRNITWDPLFFKTTGNMNLNAGGLGVINFISFNGSLLELTRRINI